MAEESSSQEFYPLPRKKKPSKVCRHFIKGFCGHRENCSYRHIAPKSKLLSSNNPQEAQNCAFYKKASCKFASKCWYNHIRPNGKVYPKPEPLNKFIVVGPAGVETEDIPSPFKNNAIPAQETKIHRSFKRPRNQDIIPKKCFYYEEKGKCHYEDKCWYSHYEPHVHQTEELLHEASPELKPDPDTTMMCYNYIFNECVYGDECEYVHGDICQYCDLPFLHPFDEKQRDDHLQACKIFFLQDMDTAFKIMISKDKMCAICLDYVWGSNELFTRQKFGIQDSCNHIFCLDCIRTWRDEKRRDRQPKICPACRIESRVVVPSARWFESEEEKKQWIAAYKAAVRRKPCKFYARGRCGDEGKCLYFHSKTLQYGLYKEDGRNDESWRHDGTWENDEAWRDVDSNNALPFVEHRSIREDVDLNNEFLSGGREDAGDLAEGREYVIDDQSMPNIQDLDISGHNQ